MHSSSVAVGECDGTAHSLSPALPAPHPACHITIWMRIAASKHTPEHNYVVSLSRKTRFADPLIVQCRATVYNGGPASYRHWVNPTCFPRWHFLTPLSTLSLFKDIIPALVSFLFRKDTRRRCINIWSNRQDAGPMLAPRLFDTVGDTRDYKYLMLHLFSWLLSQLDAKPSRALFGLPIIPQIKENRIWFYFPCSDQFYCMPIKRESHHANDYLATMANAMARAKFVKCPQIILHKHSPSFL